MDLAERRRLHEFVERFEAEQARIAAATEEIEEIKVQLVQAKFTARASLKARETHKNNEISSAHQEIETIRVEAAHSLVPEGRTLDDLMEDASLLEEVEVEVEGFNPRAVLDLQSVVSALDSEQTAAATPSDSHASSPASLEELPSELVQAAAQTLVAAQLVPAVMEKIQESVPEEAVPGETEAQEVLTLEVEPESVAEPALAETESELVVPVAKVCLAMGSEPEEAIEEPAVFGVEEALRHLHWAESKEEAQHAFRISYDQYSQVPRYIAEAVALHWIEAGHLMWHTRSCGMLTNLR
jgi:hypothetical protein